VGALSGFALRVLHQDLLEKTNAKQRTYGDLLIEINRRLCELGGFGAEHYTTIHWPDPLPVDEAAETLRDGFDLDKGVASLETVQTRRGLDPEVENERMAKERQARDVAEGNVGALLLRQFETGRGNE
jgi:hypothetical protein